jgi:hypothetical protein
VIELYLSAAAFVKRGRKYVMQQMLAHYELFFTKDFTNSYWIFSWQYF